MKISNKFIYWFDSYNCKFIWDESHLTLDDKNKKIKNIIIEIKMRCFKLKELNEIKISHMWHSCALHVNVFIFFMYLLS